MCNDQNLFSIDQYVFEQKNFCPHHFQITYTVFRVMVDQTCFYMDDTAAGTKPLIFCLFLISLRAWKTFNDLKIMNSDQARLRPPEYEFHSLQQ